MKVRKHTLSEKHVSDKIDKKWNYCDVSKKFSHPVYPNKIFNPLCINKMVKYKCTINNKVEIVKKMVCELYPCVPSNEDTRNLGYNVGKTNSSFHIIPNKMESFWDTRRGKRYIGYIEYRKNRDINKKAWSKKQLEIEI